MVCNVGLWAACIGGAMERAAYLQAIEDALLRVVFEGTAGELRASTLEDPPRVVLDFGRPEEHIMPYARAPEEIVPWIVSHHERYDGSGYPDGLAFCHALPERAGVVAIPSQAFYDDQEEGRHKVRWAFCKETATIEEGLRRLQAADLHA